MFEYHYLKLTFVNVNRKCLQWNLPTHNKQFLKMKRVKRFLLISNGWFNKLSSIALLCILHKRPYCICHKRYQWNRKLFNALNEPFIICSALPNIVLKLLKYFLDIAIKDSRSTRVTELQKTTNGVSFACCNCNVLKYSIKAFCCIWIAKNL